MEPWRTSLARMLTLIAWPDIVDSLSRSRWKKKNFLQLSSNFWIFKIFFRSVVWYLVQWFLKVWVQNTKFLGGTFIKVHTQAVTKKSFQLQSCRFNYTKSLMKWLDFSCSKLSSGSIMILSITLERLQCKLIGFKKLKSVGSQSLYTNATLVLFQKPEDSLLLFWAGECNLRANKPLKCLHFLDSMFAPWYHPKIQHW